MRLVVRQLNKIAHDATPSRQFKRELWVKLDQAHNCLYPAAVVSWRRMVAVPVVAVCIVVTMGMGTYAYASPNVADGDLLFPVKRGLENLEAKFHPSAEAKAEFEKRLIHRRVREGQVLRNKLERVRVRIDSSSLPDEEKRELLLELDLRLQAAETVNN